jgi:GWxTD domain-containing protein
VRKKISFSLLMIITAFFLWGGEEKETSKLPPKYKKWLDEDVVYIIAPIEREVFLKLKTDRERDLLQEAFWKHRDPTPGTPTNEFKEEHYRRLNYANHFFGRGIPKPGWKTDRGRIYIILGEPNDIQRFQGKTMVYPAEIWFYQGLTNFGLPSGFNLVFYQEGGFGEYKLYSPLKDGPQGLMTSYWGDPADYLAAYDQLRELEPELAQVSLSLIPGEGGATFTGRPSLSSDLLLQRVETAAVRQVEEKYAKKFLEYKDIVEVEYTANYIDSYSLVKVIKDRSGTYFVHYAIEPDKLSVAQYENKYYAKLKLNGTVSNLEGKNIYQFEKSISLDFDEERMRSIRRQPLLIQDMFPLIPGNYKLSILVKNETSKEFTSLERNLVVPQDDEALQMTSLILGYNIKKSRPQQSRLRPFQEGEYQVYFQPNRVFLRKDSLDIVFQIHGLSEEQKDKGAVTFTFFKGGEEFFSRERKVAEYQDLPDIMQQFDLSPFPPAHYSVRVSLLVDGQEVLFESDEFDVTYLEAIARPWIYSKFSPGTQNPLHFYLIGTQLFNSGQIAEAQVNLEKAFQKKPDSIDFALSLAQAYLVTNEYKKVVSVLLPFVSQPQPPKYEVFFMIGKAYQSLGELSKAIDVLDKAISYYGININLLNTIGECYFQLGKPDAALVAWQKSLEINPNQPQIKKSVEALKEKK